MGESDVRNNIVRSIVNLIRCTGVQEDIFKILRKEFDSTKA